MGPAHAAAEEDVRSGTRGSEAPPGEVPGDQDLFDAWFAEDPALLELVWIGADGRAARAYRRTAGGAGPGEPEDPLSHATEFRRAARLRRGGLSISRVEVRGHDENGMPLPTLSFAAPLHRGNDLAGVLAVVVDARPMFEEVDRLGVQVVREDGYWLAGVDTERLFGDQFERPDHNLAIEDPALWARILAFPRGAWSSSERSLLVRRVSRHRLVGHESGPDRTHAIALRDWFLLSDLDEPIAHLDLERQGSLLWALLLFWAVLAAIALRALYAAWVSQERASTKVAREREFLTNLLEALPLPVFVRDRAGLLRLCNRKYANFLRSSKGDILGRPLRQIYASGSIEESSRTDAEAFEHPRESLHFEAEVLTRTGAPRHCLVAKQAFEDPAFDDGRLLVAGTLQDISELKQIQRDLHRAKKDADSASLAKGAFLAAMSHEIRTPLNGVLGMAQLLRHTELDEEQSDLLDVVESSGEILLSLINDILDYSKIEAGRVELEPTSVHLPTLLEQCQDLILPRIESRPIALRATLDDEVPHWIEVDALRLKQVLLNLLGNAAKFTERGHIEVEVSVEDARAEALILAVEVRDTGIGISPDRLDDVFQSFSQEDRSITRRFGGTGLGLSISRSLVELMGGRMEAQSRRGEGSTFRFTLLTRRSTVDRRILAAAPDTMRGPASPNVGALRVAVAEDNLVNQKVIVRILERLGTHAEVFADGLTLVEHLRQHRREYDLLMLDIQMPRMDGLQAVRTIRSEGLAPDAYLCALTAGATEDDRRSAAEAGMDHFLTKPVQMEKIRELLVDLCALQPVR